MRLYSYSRYMKKREILSSVRGTYTVNIFRFGTLIQNALPPSPAHFNLLLTKKKNHETINVVFVFSVVLRWSNHFLKLLNKTDNLMVRVWLEWIQLMEKLQEKLLKRLTTLSFRILMSDRRCLWAYFLFYF